MRESANAAMRVFVFPLTRLPRAAGVGLWMCVIVAGLAARPTVGHAMVVSRAQLRADTSATKDNGRFEVQAVLTTYDAGAGLEAAFLSGGVAVTVSDTGGFNATVALTGCTPRTGAGGIVCASAGRRVRAKLRRINAPPFVYQLRVSARGLGSNATGAVPPGAPVKVTLRQTLPAERVGTLADCRRSGARLVCQGRQRPNIIFIVSDDQRWDTLQYMPRVLERIADQGVSFTNAFVPTALCAPSRASMLTGQYAHTHGVLTLAIPTGGATLFVGPDASTLATWLQQAGYRTGMYGKYITDYNRQCPPYTTSCYTPPGWNDWHVFVQQGYFNYRLAENGSIISYGSTEAEYSTDVLAAKAVDFIVRANGQPFFLHLATAAPHQDGGARPKPAPRHVGLFAGIAPWRPPSYDEEDISDKPIWVQQMPRAADPVGIYLTHGTWTEAIRQAQLESAVAIDEAVEAIVSALDATGQADDTIIVYTSDNGLVWGEHREFAGKDSDFEESIRVPLIIRAPGLVGAPREESRLALNIDLAPTLAAAAGVTPTSPVDGASLLPLLRDEASPWRTDFLIEHFDFSSAGLFNYAGVRTDEWKYVEYPITGEAELYDLVNDPYELDSRHADPAYDGIKATLQSRLDELLTPPSR